jgi:hypothetical protein
MFRTTGIFSVATKPNVVGTSPTRFPLESRSTVRVEVDEEGFTTSTGIGSSLMILL